MAKRFGLLVWGFGLTGVLPVFALGGNLTELESPTLVVSALVNVAFIYLLFRVHRREWLGGPGPLEVHPRKDVSKDGEGDVHKGEEKREGRPPSS